MEQVKKYALTDKQVEAIQNVIADCKWQQEGFNGTDKETDHISVSMYRNELDELLSIDFNLAEAPEVSDGKKDYCVECSLTYLGDIKVRANSVEEATEYVTKHLDGKYGDGFPDGAKFGIVDFEFSKADVDNCYEL